jgi:hypothetical protein
VNEHQELERSCMDRQGLRAIDLQFPIIGEKVERYLTSLVSQPVEELKTIGNLEPVLGFYDLLNRPIDGLYCQDRINKEVLGWCLIKHQKDRRSEYTQETDDHDIVRNVEHIFPRESPNPSDGPLYEEHGDRQQYRTNKSFQVYRQGLLLVNSFPLL